MIIGSQLEFSKSDDGFVNSDSEHLWIQFHTVIRDVFQMLVHHIGTAIFNFESLTADSQSTIP